MIDNGILAMMAIFGGETGGTMGAVAPFWQSVVYWAYRRVSRCYARMKIVVKIPIEASALHADEIISGGARRWVP